MAQNVVQYTTVPPEIWGCILAYLDTESCRAATATCRFLRVWRHLSWITIDLRSVDRKSLVGRLQHLVALLETDDSSIQNSVRTIRLQKRMPQWIHGSRVNVSREHLRSTAEARDPAVYFEFDGFLARLLRLTPRVENVTLGSLLCWIRSPDNDTMNALSELTALKRLALKPSRLIMGIGPVRLSLSSRMLEQVNIDIRDFGIHSATFVGDQPSLKYAHIILDQETPIDIARSWVALESLAFSVEKDDSSSPDLLPWLGIVETALVGAISRY
jgi:hypothetical protein